MKDALLPALVVCSLLLLVASPSKAFRGMLIWLVVALTFCAGALGTALPVRMLLGTASGCPVPHQLFTPFDEDHLASSWDSAPSACSGFRFRPPPRRV